MPKDMIPILPPRWEFFYTQSPYVAITAKVSSAVRADAVKLRLEVQQVV